MLVVSLTQHIRALYYCAKATIQTDSDSSALVDCALYTALADTIEAHTPAQTDQAVWTAQAARIL